MIIKSLPSKKLTGCNVLIRKGKNSVPRRLGDRSRNRQGTYAALSVGGVLGIGDKLFAVPFEEFKTSHDSNNNISFVLESRKNGSPPPRASTKITGPISPATIGDRRSTTIIIARQPIDPPTRSAGAAMSRGIGSCLPSRSNGKDNAVFASASEFLPSRRTIRSLREAAHDCRGCPLYKRATQTVFGKGSIHAALMLVGEVPGDQEDKQGVPFVGPAGKLLDEALDAAGVKRSEVYLTNAVKHFKWESARY